MPEESQEIAKQPEPRSQTITMALRVELMAAIGDLRSGKMDAQDAHALSKLAAQVLLSARLDLDIWRTKAAMKVVQKNDIKPLGGGEDGRY